MTSRVQLALNVADIKAATAHYTQMFGTEPNKVREGYANFAIADPPLKLVLFENPDAVGPLNHLGVEVASTEAVVAASETFSAAGLNTTTSESENCCHAVMDKVYVGSPDVPTGAWEFYTILDDDPDEEGSNSDTLAAKESLCCQPPADSGTAGTPSQESCC